jgi:hypothetical protein
MVPDPVMPRLTATFEPFSEWSNGFSCSGESRRSTTATIHLSRAGDIACFANVALKGTDAAFHGRYWIRFNIIDDINGVYTSDNTRIEYSNAPGRLVVTVREPPDSTGFKEHPYPLKIRFLTSGGAKLYTILAPPLFPVPPTDPEEIRRQQAEFIQWKVNNCYWKQSLLTRVKALQVLWLPNPSPDSRIAQHWLVRIIGLALGDIITAWDGETGRRLAMVRSASGGETEISLVLPSQRFIQSLMLTLNDMPFLNADKYAELVSTLSSPTEPGPHQIESVQTLLVPVNEIQFGTEVERIELTEEHGTINLTAYTAGGLLKTYEWTADSVPVQTAVNRPQCAQSLITTRAAGLGQAIGAFDRKDRLFRVWQGNSVRSQTMLAEYIERPWFAGGAFVGDSFVHLNDDMCSATVYRRDESIDGGITPPNKIIDCN